MPSIVLRIALLLFGSGFCALIYQTAWLRELRLIFGASTAASAAVLAIFMGGLGLGSAWLSRRVDGRERPLMMYANLELGIAITAAATPFLVDVARWVYVALGGTPALGMAVGTVVRLVLSAVVLLVPTILMGGTLPAAARAAQQDHDHARRHLSVLYACNTLGAVTGAALSTFVLLEVFGIRNTLWLACLLNLLVAMTARSMGRELAPASPVVAAAPSPTSVNDGTGAPFGLVLAAAAAVGFAFLLMELVWYRMLGPILGGSSYTFGLILAVALLGIGVGGGLYSVLGSNRQPTLQGFALTCTLEALFIALPFALGDRLAVVALLLQDLGALGFWGSVGSWAAIALVVVFPASVVSGVQFPLLMALLGKGGASIGRHVGLAYAYNTAGSILGSLAGGFGLLPALTAPGCWRLVVFMLAALGAVSLLSARGAALSVRGFVTGAVALGAVSMGLASGPTAAWRHSGVGAGRAELGTETLNGVEAWLRKARRQIGWEAEGVESSVALSTINGLAFVVNGKVDGNARIDASTQVMGGLLGAALHPNPQSALVIGLGTGSTAGWLAAVPSMERVDVAELEPAILEVARRCAPVNQDVMTSPKVHMFLGDARELMLTTPQTYDVVFSEPSNPYRAGIASLFTVEFYRAVAAKLRPGGVFIQWVQAYEVDAETVRTVYATLGNVFPHVETWQTMVQMDLLLVATKEPAELDAAALRQRLELEPYRTALPAVWRVQGLEGLLSHYVANAQLAAEIARQEGDWLNTDDFNPVEFGFARSVGKSNEFSIIGELLTLARDRNEHRPVVRGPVDWELLAAERLTVPLAQSQPPMLLPPFTAAEQSLANALALCLEGQHGKAAAVWRTLPPPRTLAALACAAAAYAEVHDPAALPLLEQLGTLRPSEAALLTARMRYRAGETEPGVRLMAQALHAARADVWTWQPLLQQSMTLAVEMAQRVAPQEPELARGILVALAEPFPVYVLEEERRHHAVALTSLLDWKDCAKAVEVFEDGVPWTRSFLEHRLECYRAHGNPRVRQAAEDLDRFTALESSRLRAGFAPVPAAASQP